MLRRLKWLSLLIEKGIFKENTLLKHFEPWTVFASYLHCGQAFLGVRHTCTRPPVENKDDSSDRITYFPNGGPVQMVFALSTVKHEPAVFVTEAPATCGNPTKSLNNNMDLSF